MNRRSAPPPVPVPGDPEPTDSTQAGPPAAGVRLTKRSPVAPPDPDAPREKICSECGARFRLDPGKKFFLCPDCYRRSFSHRSRSAGDAARILTHITCARCGTQEYVPFVPEDPAKALCRACFAAERPKPTRPPRPSRR